MKKRKGNKFEKKKVVACWYGTGPTQKQKLSLLRATWQTVLPNLTCFCVTYDYTSSYLNNKQSSTSKELLCLLEMKSFESFFQKFNKKKQLNHRGSLQHKPKFK